MCNRYIPPASPDEIAEFYQARWRAADPGEFLREVWPKYAGPVVFWEEGERVADLFRWGLIPFWAKDPKTLKLSTHNARAETADTAPSFREPFRKRRCLIPAAAFCERPELEGRRTWLRIGPADGSPFAFAGLWDGWRPAGAEPVYSYTMLTCAPSEFMRRFHGRMPVLLEEDGWNAWLDPATPAGEAKEMLVPYAGELAAEAE